MKIAFCLEQFNPERGGAEVYVADLARLMCARGHQVSVLTTTSSVLPAENLQIRLISTPRRPRFLHALAYAFRTRRAVRAEKFDVVHAFERSLGMNIVQPLGGSYAASLEGNLRSLRGRWGRAAKKLSYLLSPRRWAYFAVEKRQLREAGLVIAISAMVKSDLVRFNRVDPRRIRIVRNGVDLNKFNPANRDRFRAKVRKEIGVGPDDFVLLFVAHNFRLKGLSPLIRLMKLLKEQKPDTRFRLAVLGNGRRTKFAACARRHGVESEVLFLGGRPFTEAYYAAADICVHPSYYDPSALVVLEAMASGLPVITTVFCGASEAIEHGVSGFVIDNPDDEEKLAGPVLELLDPQLRERIGTAARACAESYPYARNQMEILEIYNEYLGSHA